VVTAAAAVAAAQEGDVACSHRTFQVHLCFWQSCDEVLPTLLVLNRQFEIK
jgi:hypothetical protein